MQLVNTLIAAVPDTTHPVGQSLLFSGVSEMFSNIGSTVAPTALPK
jgi:hypothetical protein